MNYPLKLSFKIVAIAPQIYVSDAQGNPACFVKQKLFKLKEELNLIYSFLMLPLLERDRG